MGIYFPVCILATNGQYTYGILLFVSVEQGLCFVYTAQVLAINKNYYFPYASDILNAANNTGVPGKYVVDLNGKYVIVSYCN